MDPNTKLNFHQFTKNLFYDPSKLPDQIRTKTSESLRKLLNLADSDSRKPTSYKLAVGGVLPKP
jgi:hypothetical protein